MASFDQIIHTSPKIENGDQSDKITKTRFEFSMTCILNLPLAVQRKPLTTNIIYKTAQLRLMSSEKQSRFFDSMASDALK